MHKKDMGKMGEALVIAQLLSNGYSVFTEFGDNSKVDLIVLNSSHQTHRVQVKTVGRESRTPECSKLYLTKSGPSYQFSYSEDMFDWFAMVDHQTSKIAWVPSSVMRDAVRQLTFRHTKATSGQEAGVRYFDDYIRCPFE